MEIIELSKKLFGGKEVRILGTKEDPLFVAKDIAELLEIKDISSTMTSYNVTEKRPGKVRTSTGIKDVLLLTELGLYRLLFASHKPLAAEFRQWVLDVLKEIRLTGKYDLEEKIIEQNTIMDNFNISEFIDRPVVYLIALKDQDYKFGRTGNIKTRFTSHRQKFKAVGIEGIKLLKCWKYETRDMAKKAEAMIKAYASEKGILVKKYEQTEIIAIEDIQLVVKAIDSFDIKDEPKSVKISGLEYDLRMKELEIELARLNPEYIRLKNEPEVIRAKNEIELIKAQNETLRLQIELFKCINPLMTKDIPKLPAPISEGVKLADNIADFDDMGENINKEPPGNTEEVQNINIEAGPVEPNIVPMDEIIPATNRNKYDQLVDFIRDINAGEIDELKYDDTGCVKISSRDCYNAYLNWTQRKGLNAPTDRKFFADICDFLNIKSKTERVGKGHARYYTINRQKIEYILA